MYQPDYPLRRKRARFTRRADPPQRPRAALLDGPQGQQDQSGTNYGQKKQAFGDDPSLGGAQPR
jgi:hypothetical protein